MNEVPETKDAVVKRSARSVFIISISLLLVSLATIVYSIQQTSVSDFHFNPFAILSFLPLAVNVFIIVMIMRLRARSEESVWFVMYVCALSVACLGEGLQRLSVQPEGALFWFHLNSIGFAIMPMAYYLFAFSYVKPLRLQSPLLIPSLFISAGIIIFYFSSTGLFFATDPSSAFYMPWGYNALTTNWFPILLIWIEMLMGVALLTLIRFYRRTSSDLLKRQSRVYIWAILIPLVGGTITDGILPLFGINSIVPSSLFLSTVTSIFAYYGLHKYRSFQINPAEFAANVISTMQEAVIVTGSDYKIDFVNKEAERLFGISSAELTGQHISNGFVPESWAAITHHHKPAADPTKDDPIDKLLAINGAGEQVPVNVYTSLLDEGKQNEAYIFIIADISDITESYHQLEASTARIRSQNDMLQQNQITMQRLLQESKDLQEQLRHEKENVEHTVEVRTAELREARDELKASDQLKSEFIMLSSHNLRTPLTIMRGSIEMLTNDESASAQQKTMINVLASSTERLGEFVEDLLTIATLEAGDQSKLTPTKLGDIVAPLIKEARTMAEAKDILFTDVQAQDDIYVNANALRLRGAIRNILHNAVHFTSKGQIMMKIDVTDDTCRIVVSDTGIGIAADELPKLFTKFHRGTSTMEFNYEGEGIGLYLTKLVVEEHHGQITADSVLGSGTTLTVSLPRVTPS
ncbi:MAG: hybrid sensor histidine kinase/response regulator [Candidatus Saccharibacteria bacterium]|nr:hybrid sensor histidine kinase/response regulator [Candidatus Saccharibacteria bacterium]